MTAATDSFKPRSVAEALGLGTLADSEPAMNPELLRQLYRHARGESNNRVMFVNHHTFRSGWINLNDPVAQALVSAFVPLDDEDDIKKARRIAQNNLQAQAWNDLLRIESPPIRMQVKVHGREWGYRFVSTEPAMKGREQMNEQLPPIPEDVTPDDTTTKEPVKRNHGPSLEEVMMEAGLK